MTTDDGLVARTRDGDDVAFEALYGRYHARIRGYVAGVVGDMGRAEDVTQEVFVAALRRLRETNRPVAFRPWVFEIARNAAIDEFRRARRRPETPVQHAAADGRPGLEAVAGRGPSPQVTIETRETLGDLTFALGGLSESHRRVLVLRELEGRSYDEIAAVTGLTRAAVESVLFRARRRLGTEYEELSSGRRCATVQDTVSAARRVRGRARETVRRHLTACHACRRHAALTGADLTLYGLPPAREDAAAAPARRGRGRVAALLPLPALVWLRRVAETLTGTGDGGASWGKAAAATAFVLAAGGAGVIGHRDAADNVQHPAAESPSVAQVSHVATVADRRPARSATTTTAASASATRCATGCGRSATAAGGASRHPARTAPPARRPSAPTTARPGGPAAPTTAPAPTRGAAGAPAVAAVQDPSGAAPATGDARPLAATRDLAASTADGESGARPVRATKDFVKAATGRDARVPTAVRETAVGAAGTVRAVAPETSGAVRETAAAATGTAGDAVAEVGATVGRATGGLARGAHARRR